MGLHDAFVLTDVISGIDEKLTCMTYNGDDVYLGTASGKLLLYRVRSTPGKNKVGGPVAAIGLVGLPERQRWGGCGYAGRHARLPAPTCRSRRRRCTAPRCTPYLQAEYTSTRAQTVDVSGSKSAVTQVEAVPDLNLLLAVCEGGISLWDLDSLRRRPSCVLDTKGVQFFALNVRGPPRYKLCVVSSRKRLRLYGWEAAAKNFVFVKDLDLPDVPRAVVYYGNRLACGYQREYNVLFEDTGEVRDATGVMARDTRPLIKHLPPVVVRRADASTGADGGGGGLTTSTGASDNLLIITADDVGVVLNATGEPATTTVATGGGGSAAQMSIPALQFGHHPLSLAYCYPYVISVGDNNSRIEVHATRGRRDEVVQRLDFPSGAGSSSSGGGAVCLADGRVGAASRTGLDFTDAAKGRNPVFIAFASPGRVMRLQPVPVDTQVEDMLRQGQVTAAQELLLNTAPEGVLAAKIDRLNIDAGRVLFFSLQFEAAFAHLAASEIDPREVVAMLPELQLGAAAVTAALAPEPPDGAPSVLTLARAYRYPSRYFSASLTNAVADRLKTPADAASEAADAPPATTVDWGAAVES